MDKSLSNLSVLSGSTGAIGASITPEKRIPIKKGNIKPLATSPPRKDPITNKNKTLY